MTTVRFLAIGAEGDMSSIVNYAVALFRCLVESRDLFTIASELFISLGFL